MEYEYETNKTIVLPEAAVFPSNHIRELMADESGSDGVSFSSDVSDPICSNKNMVYCPTCRNCPNCRYLRDGLDDDIASISSAESTIYDGFLSTLSEDDILEIEQRIFHEIDDHYAVQLISSPIYIKTISDELTEQFMEEWIDAGIFDPDVEDELEERENIGEWVRSVVQLYFDLGFDMPPRQNKHTHKKSMLYIASLDKRLNILANAPNPPQKSAEWYHSRYNVLTASSAWKIFGSAAQQNSLIFEKCRPYDEFMAECNRHSYLGTGNAMHWGIKYEPVTTMLYEARNGTKLGQYGCIQHPDYPFIGASPDGINVEPLGHPKRGTMVEIKNIVNREIDGIPSEAYWIQMQLQMEVCDLDDCDFVETRFKEYDDEYAFYNNEVVPSPDEPGPNPEYHLKPPFRPMYERGVILRFVPRQTLDDIIEYMGQPTTTPKTKASAFYEYMPLSIQPSPDGPSPECEVQQWISSRREANYPEFVLFETSYWYLDEYSCISVQRNRKWFQHALPQMRDCWNTILKERVEGCEHRMPKKRTAEPSQLTVPKTVCLVKMP